MEVIFRPQNYEICLNMAAIVLAVITLIIHSSEEDYYGKQRRIFGILIFMVIFVNVVGGIHNVWIYSDWAKALLGYGFNCFMAVLEKAGVYVIAVVSMCYLMAIFRIELDRVWKVSVIAIPALCSVISVFSSLFNRNVFYFDARGDMHLSNVFSGTVNISSALYLMFAAYLIYKYSKSISSEKAIVLTAFFLMMAAGIPLKLIFHSYAPFEFGTALAVLLCVYTFQNPSEFIERLSGTGTKNALNFTVYTNLIQKKVFTAFGISIDRLSEAIGSESLEASSNLLTQIATYLRRIYPDAALFYPDDGVFIMVLEDIRPDDELIEGLAEQIRRRFKDPWMLREDDVRFTESPFAVGFPDEVGSFEKFVEVKDEMKKMLLRQNREVLRVSDLNLKYAEHDKKIDNIVRKAVDNGLLEVYYQPIYSPLTGRFDTCEALVRLRDHQFGFISPAIFIPIAEKNGTVLGIDRFVLSSVCEMLAATEVLDLGIKYVEVNLSVVDCIQSNLADSVLDTLKKFRIGTDKINFEITETWEKEITSVVDDNVQKLTDAGVAFSMDDFGSGYSNVSRMATVPVKLFKLDKSIVQAAFDSEVSYMVMINMIKIIKSLGKEIVAEGVETGEQAKQLIRLGCDHIQGFFYARPMPEAQFIEFLKEHNFS